MVYIHWRTATTHLAPPSRGPYGRIPVEHLKSLHRAFLNMLRRYRSRRMIGCLSVSLGWRCVHACLVFQSTWMMNFKIFIQIDVGALSILFSTRETTVFYWFSWTGVWQVWQYYNISRFCCKLSSNLYFELNRAIASKLGQTVFIYPWFRINYEFKFRAETDMIFVTCITCSACVKLSALG